ncbi:hypothetical protein CN553_23445 [Bacillus cereus]|uniref:Uncharacterized protein n=1 Tax=Bacillus cereus TaxID=1396 RepID=A0A9X6U8I9_BACCE|nr:hypothetical protein [Bacillus cereus]PEN88557.1 hypothetical protein CN553_23445 [Bacillus cereus]
MPKLTEYELSYICYYSERVDLTNIAAGFGPKLKSKEITPLLEELRKKNIFEFYKNSYKELLEEN